MVGDEGWTPCGRMRGGGVEIHNVSMIFFLPNQP